MGERGLYAVTEGIDVTGKTTLMNGLLKYAASKGKEVFDFTQYWLSTYREAQDKLIAEGGEVGSAQWASAQMIPPDDSHLKSGFVFFGEPPYQGAGLEARMILNPKFKENFSVLNGQLMARKHSCYRETTLPAIVGPTINAGIPLFSSRSFYTFPYQYQQMVGDVERLIASGDLIEKGKPQYLSDGLNYILGLPGNQLAKREFKPDLIIVQTLDDPEVIRARSEGKALDIFESNMDFQLSISKLYTEVPFINGQTFQQFCRYLGIAVEYIDATLPPERVVAANIEAMEKWADKLGRKFL